MRHSLEKEQSRCLETVPLIRIGIKCRVEFESEWAKMQRPRNILFQLRLT